MTAIEFLTVATALTSIGWGFGYLVGKWIVWWGKRRKVRKWLDAEATWKVAEQLETDIPMSLPMPPQWVRNYGRRGTRAEDGAQA